MALDFEQLTEDFEKIMSEMTPEKFEEWKKDYEERCKQDELKEQEEHFKLVEEYKPTSIFISQYEKHFKSEFNVNNSNQMLSDIINIPFDFNPNVSEIFKSVINEKYNYVDYKFLYDFTIKYGTNIGNNSYILNIQTIDLVILMAIEYGQGEMQYNFQIIESI